MRYEKPEQLLQLARRLAGNAEGMTLKEIMAEFSVSRSTAERLRDALLRVFPTMEEFQDGASKRYRISGGLDGFYNDPTVGELGALSQAAQQLETGGQWALARPLRDLERKVRSAMKSTTLRRIDPDLEALVQAELIAVQAGPRPVHSGELLGLLRDAICAMKAVSYEYRSPSKPVRTRTVSPYGIVFGRMNYLVGPEVGDTTIKTWRFDRIANLQILKKPAPRRDDFHLPTYVRESFGFFHDDPQDVVLRVLHSGLEEFANWSFHPNQLVEPQDDGTVLVRFRASGMLELAWHLFTWQTHIQIVAPANLHEMMQFELARATTHHQSAYLAAAGGG